MKKIAGALFASIWLVSQGQAQVAPPPGTLTSIDVNADEGVTVLSTKSNRSYLSIVSNEVSGGGPLYGCRIAYNGQTPSSTYGQWLFIGTWGAATFSGSFIPTGVVSAYCFGPMVITITEGE